MNYRKKYEELLNLILSNKEEIHHLDMDRENNNINNLVAIPKKLHKQYHSYLRIYEDGLKMTVGTSLEFQKEYEFEIKKWKKHTEKLINIENEIKKYIKKRNSLLLEVI